MKYNFENLYEHVGYLFYGLVRRDGGISATDLLKLTEFVNKTWMPSASGDPTLSAYLAERIHQGIRYASTNRMTTRHAIGSFKEYFIMHALGFSSTLRERILFSVYTIQKEFAGNPESNGIDLELQRLFTIPSVSV
jgi:hypothetical protein